MTTQPEPELLNDPELVGSLMTAIDRLRAAEQELERQNEELVSLSAALEAERRRYQQLFDRAPLAHLSTDAGGLIQDANLAAGQMFHVDPRFLIAKPIAVYVEPRDRRRFRIWMLNPRDDEGAVFRLMRRPHVTFDAELRVFQDQELLSWVIRDVTDELRAEEQVWELNRELERRVAEQAGEIAAVYEQLPVGVGIVHAAAPASPRLNPRARQILGEAFPFDELIARALQGEEIRSATVETSQPRRGEVVLEVAAGPLRGAEGGVIGAVLTFDDVTGRERMDRADREFVTNASHQLRTPIAAIGSAIAALQAGAKDDTVERDRFLEHLELEAERLARIIEAMLVLSRASRRELDAPLTLVPLRPILERLVSEVSPADGVAVELDCDHAAAAIAHPALVEEAVASALANAVEHTSEGTISVAAHASDGRVEIAVVDTGPGMEPAIRDRAFERFFSSTPTRRGAGLGLAIAAAAVRASRGEIELSSEPGCGTQVRIRLPGAPLIGS